jgi:hypothetical protein
MHLPAVLDRFYSQLACVIRVSRRGGVACSANAMRTLRPFAAGTHVLEAEMPQLTLNNRYDNCRGSAP